MAAEMPVMESVAEIPRGASMGPQLIGCGDQSIIEGDAWFTASFNGAAADWLRR